MIIPWTIADERRQWEEVRLSRLFRARKVYYRWLRKTYGIPAWEAWRKTCFDIPDTGRW